MTKLNAFQLKIIALILMVMDHLYFAFPTVFPLWFHPISRVVAPIFAFLLVEGFFRTRNRRNYTLRLVGWAIFMEIGNYCVNLLFADKGVMVHNNIFATLALGLMLLNVIEWAKQQTSPNNIIGYIGAVVLVAASVFVEGGMVLIPFILITYAFRGAFKKQLIGYLVLCAFTFFLAFQPYPTFNETMTMLMYNSDFLFITVVPFIMMYNGQRGPNTPFNRYLFYVAYPLHLWLIAAIAYFIQ